MWSFHGLIFIYLVRKCLLLKNLCKTKLEHFWSKTKVISIFRDACTNWYWDYLPLSIEFVCIINVGLPDIIKLFESATEVWQTWFIWGNASDDSKISTFLRKSGERGCGSQSAPLTLLISVHLCKKKIIWILGKVTQVGNDRDYYIVCNKIPSNKRPYYFSLENN